MKIRVWSLAGAALLLAAGCELCETKTAFPADGRLMDVGDWPANGLALVPVPETLTGAGALRVTLDGAPVAAQEIRGAG